MFEDPSIISIGKHYYSSLAIVSGIFYSKVNRMRMRMRMSNYLSLDLKNFWYTLLKSYRFYLQEK